jgi:transcriptional regulator with XRE-family HTH domain
MDILSDRAKREIQLKLGHYLASYRKVRALTQEEMATRLGYSLSQYKRTELGLEARVANAVEFLAVFADLTGKTVGEFVQYLQNTPVETRANLAENEVKLLSGFGSVPLDTRRAFVAHYCNEQKDKLATLLEIANGLKRLSSAQLIVIQFLVSVIVPNKDAIYDKESSHDLISRMRQLLDLYETTFTQGEPSFPTTI